MPFRRTCYCNFKLVTKFPADKLDKICRIVKISARGVFSSREIPTKSKDVINALSQVCLKLVPDSFFGVLDNRKMSYRNSTGFLYHLTYFSVRSYIAASSSVCNRDIFWFKLTEMLDRSRKILHTLVGLGREQFKRKELSFLHQLSQFY